MRNGGAAPTMRARIRLASALTALAVCAVVVASYAALPSALAASPAPISPAVHLGTGGPKAEPTVLHPAPSGPSSQPSLPGAWTTPHVAFHVDGLHPQSWGSSTPPGAPSPVLPRSSGAHAGGSNASWMDQRCYGIWPSVGGQSQYYADCYGHDEPGLAPYSNLGGSGGNVTWNVTLPVDRSPTQNQSNLYAAIWFGMTLTDPFAWMNQCFLELQFYPDSSWTSAGTVSGNWVGAAFAWQIEAATGIENPCYSAPLMVTGSPGSFFSMTQGDSVNVTMSGWIGDQYGENLTVTDTSSHQSSFLNLYNTSGNYPLDPSYATSAWSNSLWWTPGGETPVSFAFETGHAGNPSFPSSNGFGGCSPGAPPPTGADPAVPCPSYDPGFWANDTLLPWQIQSPTFFNATARATATQVGFTQDLGGLDFIDGSDLATTCLGHETSAYCSYPWYSYSCSTHAYNFGATDYPTTTDDFGKVLQYRGQPTWNADGLGYFPPTNQTVPACGASVGNVSVLNAPGTEGNITFLNQTVVGGSPTIFPNVSNGTYSIAAWSALNDTFVGWVTSGSVSVGNIHDAYTSLVVNGTGGVTAFYLPSSLAASSLANVTFASSTSGATFSVVSGYASNAFGRGHLPGTWDVAAGAKLHLTPGLYTVEGQPPSKYNFTGWATSAGISVSAPAFPDTILDVEVGASATLTASYAPSPSTASVLLDGFALNGTFSLNGTSYPRFAFATLPVGTYNLSFVPNPGGQFYTWQASGSALMTNFSQTTRVTLEAGSSDFFPVGYQSLSVTLNDSGGNGYVAWNSTQNASAVSVPSGTVLPLNVSGLFNPDFGITATAKPGWVFQDWSLNNSSAAFFIPGPLGQATSVFLNASVTVTANYVAAPSDNLSFSVYPSGGGTISFGYNGTHATSGVTEIPPGLNGTFVVEFPNPGFVVKGLGVTNATAYLAQYATPTSTPWLPSIWYVTQLLPNATLNATFAPLTYPVTFVADLSSGGPTASVNGTVLGTGETVWLPNGTYPLDETPGAGTTFVRWTASWSPLTVAAPLSLSTTLTVNGPGTLYGLASAGASQPLVSVSVSPSSQTVLPGGSATFNATIVCLGNTTCANGTVYTWASSNTAAGSLNGSLGPSVRFTAARTSATTDLTVNATLGGATVGSTVVPVAVVPALTGAQLGPATTTIFSGQSVLLGVGLSCSFGLTCPGGASYLYSESDPSLGTLVPMGPNATDPSTVQFHANPDLAGTENITVQVHLNGVNQTAGAQVLVARPLLTSVLVSPTTLTILAGVATALSALGTCTQGLPCPSVPSFSWALSSSLLGSLNATSGSQVAFTAGPHNTTGWLNVTGALNGVVAPSTSVRITVETIPVVLTSVGVTPGSASIAIGSVQVFSASLGCSPSPCPTGVTITWAVAPALGTLSTTSGTSTMLTGTAVGTATVYANATLNGTTVRGVSSPVTVIAGASGTSTSTPVYDNPLLWVAVVVILVVVLAAFLLLRRGASGPTTGAPPPGANDPPKSP